MLFRDMTSQSVLVSASISGAGLPIHARFFAYSECTVWTADQLPPRSVDRFITMSMAPLSLAGWQGVCASEKTSSSGGSVGVSNSRGKKYQP